MANKSLDCPCSCSEFQRDFQWLAPLSDTGVRLNLRTTKSTIDSEGFKGGTRGSPIMPRDAVSRTANVGT